jgi:predicted enzyme related to lactoylglutathione lyase
VPPRPVMEVLASRVLLSAQDPQRARRFYGETLGLAVFREYGPPGDPGVVFFLGQGFLEVSRSAAGEPPTGLMLWLQVRDVRAEWERLRRAGVTLLQEPERKPWGLVEAWIEDPEGVRIVLVEVPEDHPLRRDTRDSGGWRAGLREEPQG